MNEPEKVLIFIQYQQKTEAESLQTLQVLNVCGLQLFASAFSPGSQRWTACLISMQTASCGVRVELTIPCSAVYATHSESAALGRLARVA